MLIWIRGLCVCVGSEERVLLCCAHIGSTGCMSMMFLRGVCQCCVLRVVWPCWFLRGVLSVLGLRCACSVLVLKGVLPYWVRVCVPVDFEVCFCSCVLSKGYLSLFWVLRCLFM